jgi:hypothetical protein
MFARSTTNTLKSKTQVDKSIQASLPGDVELKYAEKLVGL